MVDAHVELVDPIPMTGWKIIRLGTVESCGRKPRFYLESLVFTDYLSMWEKMPSIRSCGMINFA